MELSFLSRVRQLGKSGCLHIFLCKLLYPEVIHASLGRRCALWAQHPALPGIRDVAWWIENHPRRSLGCLREGGFSTQFQGFSGWVWDPHPVIKLESGYLFKMMRALFKHINTDFLPHGLKDGHLGNALRRGGKFSRWCMWLAGIHRAKASRPGAARKSQAAILGWMALPHRAWLLSSFPGLRYGPKNSSEEMVLDTKVAWLYYDYLDQGLSVALLQLEELRQMVEGGRRPRASPYSPPCSLRTWHLLRALRGKKGVILWKVLYATRSRGRKLGSTNNSSDGFTLPLSNQIFCYS